MGVAACATISLGAATSALHAQCDVEETAIVTPDDPAAFDYFARSVSIDGQWAAIGELGDDDAADRAGAVWIYRREGDQWVPYQKIINPEAGVEDEFGRSVRIRGNRLIIGATGYDGFGQDAGTAYIATFDGELWSLTAQLRAEDGAPEDLFGTSVDIRNDIAIVSAICQNGEGPHAGAAYVFARTSGNIWVQTQKVTAPDAEPFDYFGVDIAMDQDNVIIGAYADDDMGDAAGAAYVFSVNSGILGGGQKLTASDGTADDVFGVSVAIHGDYAVVGANGEDEAADSAGAAYLYQRVDGSWLETAKLVASDGGIEDYFGTAVAMHGNTVLVGAHGEDDGAANAGSAYIFRIGPDEITESGKIIASDAGFFDAFSYDLAIDGNTALVGAHFAENGTEVDAGAAYFFELVCTDLCEILNGDCNGNGEPDLVDIFVNHTSSDCNDNARPDECDIADGISLDENRNGIPDECETEPCLGDLNGDGMVDAADVLIIFAQWGLCD